MKAPKKHNAYRAALFKMRIGEILVKENNIDPESLDETHLIPLANQIIQRKKELFTPNQLEIFNLLILGYSETEAAKVLDKNQGLVTSRIYGSGGITKSGKRRFVGIIDVIKGLNLSEYSLRGNRCF